MQPSSLLFLLCVALWLCCSSINAFETVNKADQLQHDNGLDETTDTADDIFTQYSSLTPNPHSSVAVIETRRFQIRHSIDGVNWHGRGSVEIRFANSEKGVKNTVKFSGQHLSSTEAKQLLKQSTHSFYRLQFIAMDSTQQQRPIQASIRSCQLLSSSFYELFTFHFSQSGHLQSVSYITPITDCSVTAVELTEEAVQLKQKSRIAFGRKGETVKYIRMQQYMTDSDLATSKQSKDNDGKQQDEKSFFQKYWIYIVPLLFIVLVNVFFTPPEQQQQQQQQQRRK